MSKSNPWLSHVSQFRKKNPNLEYKQVLIEARKTYVPVSKAKPGKTVKGKKGQKGQGVGTAIAETIGKTAGNIERVISNISSNIKDSQEKNGSYSNRITNRKRNMFKRLKADMAKGNFPVMSDEKLLQYIENNIHA